MKFACTLTASITLLNFKVKGQGHMSFFVFFCVHNAAATRGQYLALSNEQGLMILLSLGVCWILFYSGNAGISRVCESIYSQNFLYINAFLRCFSHDIAHF